jgi:transcriptional regulatory protein LevR
MNNFVNDWPHVLQVTIGQKVTIQFYAHFCFQIIFILIFNYLKKMYGIKHIEYGSNKPK